MRLFLLILAPHLDGVYLLSLALSSKQSTSVIPFMFRSGFWTCVNVRELGKSCPGCHCSRCGACGGALASLYSPPLVGGAAPCGFSFVEFEQPIVVVLLCLFSCVCLHTGEGVFCVDRS